MPIGNYLSQYFGNLYLSSLDHIMKEELKAKYYFRYCDDIVILHHSKHYLRFCLFVIKINIKKLKLKLKRNYQIFKTYKRGLDFLGFRFFKRYTLLRKSIALGFKRASRKNKTNSISSYYGWIKSCNAFNLWNAFYKQKVILLGSKNESS